MIHSKSTNQNVSSAGGRSQNLRLAEDLVLGQAVFLSLPLPPPRRFVTRPTPIFARVQDGAGDRELCVFRGFVMKTPANRLQAG